MEDSNPTPGCQPGRKLAGWRRDREEEEMSASEKNDERYNSAVRAPRARTEIYSLVDTFYRRACIYCKSALLVPCLFYDNYNDRL